MGYTTSGFGEEPAKAGFVAAGPRGAAPAASRTRRSLTFIFPLLLAFLLSACSLSTDTVATVGGEKITRGELAALGATTPASQAAALDNLIYGRLIELEARAQKITVTDEEIAAQNRNDITASQGTDGFVQAVLQQGYPSTAAYYQTLRQQLLIQKMRPTWFTGNVEAVTLQLLTTDSQQRAQEVTQKGRGGAAFDDLLKEYAPPQAQTPEVINSPGSIAINSLNERVRSSFPQIAQGAWSEPLPTNGGQFAVLYIAKVESRAPTEQEGQGLLLAWLDSLKAKYPFTITDPTIRGAAGQ